MSLPKTTGLEVNKHIARAIIRAAAEALGGGFHPDTPAKDYVSAGGGKPTPLFENRQQRARFDAAMAAADALLGDEVYELTGPDEDEPAAPTGLRVIDVAMWPVGRDGKARGGAAFQTKVLAGTHLSAAAQAVDIAAADVATSSVRSTASSSLYVGWRIDVSENRSGPQCHPSTQWTSAFDGTELKSIR